MAAKKQKVSIDKRIISGSTGIHQSSSENRSHDLIGPELLDSPVTLVKSFYKPFVLSTNFALQFLNPTSGVPPGERCPYGYWVPRVKPTNPAITVWYYYAFSDGPYGSVPFGTLNGARWVRRANVPPNPSKSDRVEYPPGERKAPISSRVGIKMPKKDANGYTSGSASSGGESDDGLKSEAWSTIVEREEAQSQTEGSDAESSASDAEYESNYPSMGKPKAPLSASAIKRKEARAAKRQARAEKRAPATPVKTATRPNQKSDGAAAQNAPKTKSKSFESAQEANMLKPVQARSVIGTLSPTDIFGTAPENL